ncbi:MAG: globin family protein [Myxococcota bacterium]
MTPEQIELIETSWERVEALGDAAFETFYRLLFEKAPEARALFPDDMSNQRLKLRQTLALVVSSLRKLDVLAPKVAALGARHVEYGAKPEHYPVVGEALLETLAGGLGEAWTQDVEGAWSAAYGLLSEVMIQAADSTATPAA